MVITKVFHLFGGKLGLRLFLVVFLSIVAIETVILLPSYLGYRRDLENRLEHVGRTIVVMALQPRGHADDADLLNHARMAARYSELAGGTLYRPDGSLIGYFGEPPELSPSDAGERPVFTRMTADGKRLEVVWSADEPWMRRFNALWHQSYPVPFSSGGNRQRRPLRRRRGAAQPE